MNPFFLNRIAVFLLFYSQFKVQVFSRTLELAQMVFRHSNRTPIRVYKNSPCQASVYKDGLGAITTEGLIYAYEYGKRLRQRYITSNTPLLSGSNFRELYVRSSESSRCIQTVSTILSSFYTPQNTRYEWNTNLNWFPIPIRTFPRENDTLLRSGATICPRLTEILKSRFANPKMKEFIANHSSILEEITYLTGETINEHKIWEIYQSLQIEYYDKLSTNPICGKIPPWLNVKLLTQLETLTYQVLNILFLSTEFTLEDEEFPKLLGGPLLQAIVTNARDYISNSRPTKMYMYSGHDSTIYSFMSALGLTHDAYVQYLTTLTLELYRNEENEFEIDLLIYDGSDTDNMFTKIDIPSCAYPCLLDTFIKNYQHVLSTNRAAECGYTCEKDDAKNVSK